MTKHVLLLLPETSPNETGVLETVSLTHTHLFDTVHMSH